MVYDGYVGRFVPVEDASFDAATAPGAVVELPWRFDEPERRRPARARRRRSDG